MNTLFRFSPALLVVFALSGNLLAKGPQIADPEKADTDYKFQGEYVGKVTANGEDVTFGIQVIALGEGKFRAVTHSGGLPGAGWDGGEKMTHDGQRDGDTVTFKSDHATGVIRDGVLTVDAPDAKASGKLKKIVRKSPTLGKKPPEGAVVLFDGKSTDHWNNGKMTEDGLLMQGVSSKPAFQSHTLHIEFRLPYQPQDRGQGRGNSGIYVQGRYEVQMLDSFGLEGKNNECGGIYETRDPDLNMCLPPLTWQTYDIEFTAAKFDGDKMISKPRVTVRHNGVIVHKDVELPKATRAAPMKPSAEPGPIYLQNHGNPVRYRNIWAVTK